jgi:anaerobic magnesium-protoporphyrin IX monomethyl ester cyclase
VIEGKTPTSTRSVRVCVVRPPTPTSVGAVGQDAVPPIGPAYITAALLKAGHEVSAVDAVGEAPDQYTKLQGYQDVLVHGLTDEEIVARIPDDAEVIGISSMFSVEWPVTRRTIESIREGFPEALLVLGGEHLTATPVFSLDDCKALDVGVLGEGEETFCEILEAFATGRGFGDISGIVHREDGETRLKPRRARIRNVDAVPNPSWDLWPVENYIEREFTHGINMSAQ